MKETKTILPFKFKNLTHQNMVDLLNAEYPISLKKNKDLVNRVAEKYPLLSKAQVALIVKGIFESFRDLLVLGKIMNFHGMFFDTKLKFYTQIYKNIRKPSVKIAITTPPHMK